MLRKYPVSRRGAIKALGGLSLGLPLISSALPGVPGTKTAVAPGQEAPPSIEWKSLRGFFRLSFNLSPAVSEWSPGTQGQKIASEYHGSGYVLTINESRPAGQESVISYQLSRPDRKPFRVINTIVECKTNYAGVYKMFSPATIAQQNYQIDLPFRLSGGSSGLGNQPVIWMQQTDGRNALTFGLLNQLPVTSLEGSTYDTGNGGEAPGIANSYVRATMNRSGTGSEKVAVCEDGIYINAEPDITWHEALLKYSRAVDKARAFRAQPPGKDAMNPMWHSWYAHADVISQQQLLEDAKNALALGIRTIEIDAGWNTTHYVLDNEGFHDFESSRFPDPKGMIGQMHGMGVKVILHVAPLVMGKNAATFPEMKDCLAKRGGETGVHLDPRYRKVHDYLIRAWTKLFADYGVDGLWYDFLEVPTDADMPEDRSKLVSADLPEAYTLLMKKLYEHSLKLNPNAVIILRRGSANLNSKEYCTHVWPMDTPQDYNMNRRDVVYMKTFGEGVLTHACCTSWTISECDENVARQMASIVLAGVPAISILLSQSPRSHNEIIAAWLKFYNANKNELLLGQMQPLLPTPPSAAVRIEAGEQAFFGFFEAAPGLLNLTAPASRITLINAFSQRTFTRIEGVPQGTYEVEVYDQVWRLASKSRAESNSGGLNLDVTAPSRCHSVLISNTAAAG